MSNLALCDISDILPKHQKTAERKRQNIQTSFLKSSYISGSSVDEKFKNLAEEQNDLLDDLYSASREMNESEGEADAINSYQVLEESK